MLRIRSLVLRTFILFWVAPFLIQHNKAYANSSIRCDAIGLCHFDAPIVGTPISAKLVAWHRPPGRDAPTVVLLGGGPGESLLNQRDQWIQRLGIPNEFGVVLMDSRGLGTNALSSVLQSLDETEALNVLTQNQKSLQVAKDLLAVILKLSLNRIIVFGVSYGTVPALILTDLIERSHPSKAEPLGLILDSVIDSFEDGSQIGLRMSAAFDQTLNQLPALSRARVRSRLSKLATYYESTGLLISPLDLLIQGLLVQKQDNPALKTFLQFVLSTHGDNLKKLQEYVDTHAPNVPSVDQVRFFHNIYCSDLASLGAPRFPVIRWDTGSDRVRPSGLNSCPDSAIGGQTLRQHNLFQSSRYKVHSPIVYFSGGKDIATPRSQALAHASRQTLSSNLVEVFLPSGGHAVLADLSSNCKTELWSILNTQKSNSPEPLLRVQEKCR